MNGKYLTQLKLKTETFCESIPEKKIDSSMIIYKLLRDYIWDVDTMDYEESCYAVFLTGQNKLIGFSLISIGTIESCYVDVAKIAKLALLCNCKNVVISHNHPTGNTNPSEPDKIMTNKLKNALSLFQIKLIDHVIVSKTSFFSFADQLLL